MTRQPNTQFSSRSSLRTKWGKEMQRTVLSSWLRPTLSPSLASLQHRRRSDRCRICAASWCRSVPSAKKWRRPYLDYWRHKMKCLSNHLRIPLQSPRSEVLLPRRLQLATDQLQRSRAWHRSLKSGKTRASRDPDLKRRSPSENEMNIKCNVEMTQIEMQFKIYLRIH